MKITCCYQGHQKLWFREMEKFVASIMFVWVLGNVSITLQLLFHPRWRGKVVKHPRTYEHSQIWFLMLPLCYCRHGYMVPYFSGSLISLDLIFNPIISTHLQRSNPFHRGHRDQASVYVRTAPEASRSRPW